MTITKPSKYQVISELLHFGSIYVHLDPRKPGVKVPPWLAKQPKIILQFGYDLPVPIPDLSPSEDWLVGTLRFGGLPFECRIPMTAVFAVVDFESRGGVWPDDMPADYDQSPGAHSVSSESTVTKLPSQPTAGRSHLRLIPGGKSSGATSGEPSGSAS
jgi:stringent starvation protein B